MVSRAFPEREQAAHGGADAAIEPPDRAAKAVQVALLVPERLDVLPGRADELGVALADIDK